MPRRPRWGATSPPCGRRWTARRCPLDRRTPKYQVIAADLAAKIRGGELPPGAALPPQKELSGTYGVTLVTLRQALRQLEDDGLLSQQPGRGTFVTSPAAAYHLGTLRGFAEDLRAQGQTVTTEILGQELGRAPAWTGLPGRVLRLERRRLLAGRPAVHQLSWVPGAAGAALATADLSATSLYAAIAGLGTVVHRAAETVRAGLLDSSAAVLLRQPAGSPVFVSDRITHGLDDGVLVVDRAVILASAMEIRTERATTGLSVQWSRS